jgi:AraC-like DNA-binding protein
MQLSSIFEITLTTMAFSIALFGAVSLWGEPSFRRSSWGLALFLGVAAFDTATALIGYWGSMPQFVWLGGLEPLVTSLYGPTIYLYALTLTGKAPPVPRATLILVAPALVAFIPFAMSQTLPADAQLAMLVGATLPQAVAGKAAATMIAMQAIFLATTLGFLIACWSVLDDNQRQLTKLFSSIEDRTLSWLRYVIIIIFAAWGWAAVVIPLEHMGLVAGWLDAVDAAITLVWISVLAYFGPRQHPTLAERAEVLGQPETSQAMIETEGTEKYARSALDETRMQKLADRMVKLMQDTALHRDAGLSLRRLADQVGASPNYISQTLNDHLGVSFFDFVNSFRVDEAERLLRETDDTITDIALAVGFNSRSTFNAAIRKHRGTSPTDIRRQG